MLSSLFSKSRILWLPLSRFSSSVSQSPISVTDACIQRIRQLKKQNPTKPVLRIYVDSGGCSGFQYMFEMAAKAERTDQSFNFADIEVAVDVVSIQYLQGSTVDYEEEMIRSSFAIVANPKADLSCSCGTSFSVKE